MRIKLKLEETSTGCDFKLRMKMPDRNTKTNSLKGLEAVTSLFLELGNSQFFDSNS